MYRWPWLENQLRRHPGAGLAVTLVLLAGSVWALVSAPMERGRRTGLPMWLLAGFLAVMMTLAAIRFAVLLVRGRSADRDSA